MRLRYLHLVEVHGPRLLDLALQLVEVPPPYVFDLALQLVEGSSTNSRWHVWLTFEGAISFRVHDVTNSTVACRVA